MKRSAISYLFAALLLLPGVLCAQVEKRVEVSKAYVPSVERAAKLSIRPNMVDTVVMQPEIDYSVTPLSLTTELVTRPIRPATVTYWAFDRPLPFYVKAGVGYPLHSALDVYASTQNADIGYALGYINHNGQYGRIPHTQDGSHSALWQDNRIGVAAGKYLGRHTLEGEVSYESRIVDRYGLFPDAEFPTFDVGHRRVFGDLQARVRIGDDFTDLKRTNFNVEISGGNWWNPLDATDRLNLAPSSGLQWDYLYKNQSNLAAKAAIGRQFGRHKLILKAGFQGRWGGDSRQQISGSGVRGNYRNLIYSGALRYAYQARSVDMEFGLDYYRDDVAGRKAADYFIPYLHLRFDLGNGVFVPYVELDGTLQNNSLRELMQKNPYYTPSYGGLMPKNTVDYSLRIGVSGRLIEDKLIYRLFVGYSFLENHNFWYAYRWPTDLSGGASLLGFDLMQGRLNAMSLNGEIEFRPVSNFTFSIGGRGLTYTEHESISIGLPEFEGTIRARYHHPKFSIGALFNFQANRYISTLSIPTSEQTNYRIPYTIDLRLNVDWYASTLVTVFAEGRNLCNQRLYDWSGFPQYGVGFTAGVKLNF